MAGSLVTLVRQSPLNGGTTVPGAKLFVYNAGTTTKRAVYTTSALSVQHSNPVVADSNGRFAAVWIDPSGGAYKLVLASASDSDPPTSPFWTEDNIPTVIDEAQLPTTLTARMTFTGVHSAANGTINLASAQPLMIFNESDAGSSNKVWGLGVSSEGFYGLAYSDDGSSNASWMEVNRTGTTVDSITFSATNIFFGVNAGVANSGVLFIKDGVTAPSTSAGFALIYVDTADGDLKVKFGDGTVKTLATDT